VTAAPAGVGRRVAAAVVDLLLTSALFVVLAAVAGELETAGGSFTVRLENAGFLLFLALVFAYFTLTEGTTGRSLGKALLGLRVVALDGRPAGLGRAAARTALRVVDALPFLYLVAFVVVLATPPRRQRVGDLVAKTLVVRG